MTSSLSGALKRKSSTTTEKGLGRAHEILSAARTLLAADGYAGLSMRRVAAETGMSLSNLQHYYTSKDALLEALLLYTMDVFQGRIDAIAADMAGAAPLERFLSMVDMFLDEITEPVTHAIFFEIWALASRNPFASRLMDTMMARERKTIFKLIAGLAPGLDEKETMQRAVLIVAQVEGMMLFRLDRHRRRAEFDAARAALREVVMDLATRA
jgi:AcrR family transcriptional regulator